MAEADFFLPAVWSLDSANVQAIESSATDPKVRMDSTGLFVTDATGTKLVTVDPNGLRLDADTGPVTPPRMIEWVRSDNGAVVARLNAGTQAAQTPYPSGGADSVGISMTAIGPRSFAQAGIDITAPDNNNFNSTINVHAGDRINPVATVMLLRSDGVSDFARQNAFNTSQLVSGPWTGQTVLSTFLQSGLYWVGMSVSCYGNAVGLTGVSCFQGGVFIGQSVMYFNEAGSHKTMPTSWIPITLPTPGTYTFQIANGSNALSDTNDTGSLVIIPRH